MSDHESTLPKARIKACADQARINAHHHGCDDSTAAMDLLCAFALICQQNGADPETALKPAWHWAKEATEMLFPRDMVN